KVRYLGSSTWPASAIVEGQWVAERRQRERFVCEQPPYSILVRGIEADVLPVCERHGMGVICWSPLAGGWLSGRDDLTKPGSNRAERIPLRFDMTLAANQAKLAAARSLARVAADAGLEPIHMALAFVTNHPGVTSAIIGCRTMAQLESQLGAADVDIDAAVFDRIDEIVPPGTNLNQADAGWIPPSLTDPARRRRCRPPPPGATGRGTRGAGARR